MSNLHKHALMEFKAAKWLDDNGNYIDDMQEAICTHVLKLLLFSRRTLRLIRTIRRRPVQETSHV